MMLNGQRNRLLYEEICCRYDKRQDLFAAMPFNITEGINCLKRIESYCVLITLKVGDVLLPISQKFNMTNNMAQPTCCSPLLLVLSTFHKHLSYQFNV